MSDKPPDLPKIHHIQVKLSPEEYQLFSDLAHAARTDRTPYAREVFLAAMKREQVRLGIAHASRKRA